MMQERSRPPIAIILRTIVLLLAPMLLALTSDPSPAMSASIRTFGKNPAPQNVQAVPNIFEAANGKHITYADLDRYISPSVRGADRELARHLMALMPQNQRGDFIYVDGHGRLLSNNPSRLRYVKLSFEPAKPTQPKLVWSQLAAASNRAGFTPFDDYQSPCSPPNPPPQPGGPYVRNVSACGFAAGWAFLFLPCATTQMNDGDSGHLYWELRGSLGSLVEGGLEYYSDHPSPPPNISGGQAPYLRSTAIGGNGYETLINGSARYDCGQNMAIVHGATLPSAGPYTFTEIGIVPSGLDPETEWINQEIVTLNNAAWLFGPAPTDVTGDSIDNAGYETPCMNCSISQVTSIAQHTNSYSQDGSYFGVYLGTNAINWLQTAMGNWASDCAPGTTLCTIDVASDPGVYYGGPQYYPNSFISQSNFGPTGYGPYETFDGILLPENVLATQRSAGGQFAEPLPPLPCTLDGDGYCAYFTTEIVNNFVECTKIIDRQPVQETIPSDWNDYYEVYGGRTQVSMDAAHTTQNVSPSCVITNRATTWAPGEPRVQYGDPNLP